MNAPALSRRGFLAGASSLAGLLGGAGPAFALPSAEQQLIRLMDKLWAEQQRRFPSLAPRSAETPAQPRMADWSRAGRAAWTDWAGGAVRQIEAIDATALPRATETNRAILLDHFGRIATLGSRYRFGAAACEADAPVAPYAISPVTGPHRSIPDQLLGRPVTGRGDAEQWLTQLAGFSHALDAATAAFREDAAAGIALPAFAREDALHQLGALRSPAPGEHPLVHALADQLASAGLAGTWADKAAALLAAAVYPALDRQIAALTEARAAAAHEAGAWTLPQGQQFYADALAWHTGTTLSAAQAHALGQERVARLTAEMDPLLAGLGLPDGRVGQRLQALARRPDEAFPDDAGGRAAVLTAVSAAIERIRPRLPELFALPAPAQLAVQPLPAELAQRRPEACLLGGDLSGTRPGTVYVNLQTLDAWPRYCIASTAFHGSIPAHLWEGAAAAAAEDMPAIRNGMRYAACTDGWSLYAEQVADEQGFYASDRVSRLGYLRTQLTHAARLVADTGLNDRRWTLDQTAAYLADTTGLDLAGARREAETMALRPGRACANAVGQAEWVRLRALGQRIAGSGFDQRRFHQLIRVGGAPFDVIESLVTTTFTRRLSTRVMRTA